MATLEELVLILEEKPGIWAVLDPGATRSLGGSEVVEDLVYDMKEIHDIEFEMDMSQNSFTFGDGNRKASISAVTGSIFLADTTLAVRLSVMDNMVPILLGMDVLADATGAILDCGNGYLGLPKICCDKVFYCEKLPSGHLAVNLTSPTWWTEVPRHVLVSSATVEELAAGGEVEG